MKYTVQNGSALHINASFAWCHREEISLCLILSFCYLFPSFSPIGGVSSIQTIPAPSSQSVQRPLNPSFTALSESLRPSRPHPGFSKVVPRHPRLLAIPSLGLSTPHGKRENNGWKSSPVFYTTSSPLRPLPKSKRCYPNNAQVLKEISSESRRPMSKCGNKID